MKVTISRCDTVLEDTIGRTSGVNVFTTQDLYIVVSRGTILDHKDEGLRFVNSFLGYTLGDYFLRSLSEVNICNTDTWRPFREIRTLSSVTYNPSPRIKATRPSKKLPDSDKNSCDLDIVTTISSHLISP